MLTMTIAKPTNWSWMAVDSVVMLTNVLSPNVTRVTFTTSHNSIHFGVHNWSMTIRFDTHMTLLATFMSVLNLFTHFSCN